ncbi:MAG TPA: hypothetical protein VL463_14320 [Kofleriaceae bacterium]|jgi:hypothetical protein|nr:hypothetical protein [Kofleriaceae bacterium]
MGVLDSLLGRLGFVRLDQYGLVRSPDGRITMMHRRVLDDGMGGRIVGWRADDPAPTVLEPMDLVPRTAVKQVEAARASIAMAAKHVPAAVTAAVEAKKPEATIVEDEDGDEDWEWQLALARARAAADEAEAASVKLPTLVAATKSEPVLAVAKLTPSRTQPVPVVAPAPPPAPAPISKMANIEPIERARIARGSAPPNAAQQSSRVMSPPKAPVIKERAKPPAIPARAAERPLPLPAPEDTTRTRPAPPAVPTRPAAVAAAAATARADSRMDSEITKTDLRPPLPRYSARFR